MEIKGTEGIKSRTKGTEGIQLKGTEVINPLARYRPILEARSSGVKESGSSFRMRGQEQGPFGKCL